MIGYMISFCDALEVDGRRESSGSWQARCRVIR